jgi:hypothetical protein
VHWHALYPGFVAGAFGVLFSNCGNAHFFVDVLQRAFV